MMKVVILVNKSQKEVQQAHLNAEKHLIKLLERVYGQARNDCEKKIMELSSRTDLENLQSIIYQKQYQEALKKQLEGILDNLQSEEFTSIADYLQKSYHNGYVGVMYDLTKQGIPLIIPINQELVVKALQTDSKLSKGLYARLGEDVNYLKRSIRAELSRGIANGSTWNEIAGKIAKGMNSPFNKSYNRAILIARTEGHRIQQRSALDGQFAAKEKGADVLKQWDSTLDRRTRPHHRQLDGQIRELEEDFEVDGLKAQAPGHFGKASEDCNCRCCLLQRARWALDEDELNELKERAAYFGLDKTKDFDDFSKKYLKAAQELDTINLEDALKECKTADEVSVAAEKYFRNKNGCNIERVDLQGVEVNTAKKMMMTVDDMDNRFHSSVKSIKAKYLNSGIGGSCTPTDDSAYEYLNTGDYSVIRSNIELNKDFLKSKKIIAHDFNTNYRSQYGGVAHGAWVDESNAGITTMVHEYGHSICPGKLNEIYIEEVGTPTNFMTFRRLYNTYMRELRSIEKEIMEIRDSFTGQPDGLKKGLEAAKPLQEKYDSLCISYYSKNSIGEFIAEAFCDYELSSNPKPASVKVHDALVKLYGKGE